MFFEHNNISYFLTLAFTIAFGVLYRPDIARPVELLSALSAAAARPHPLLRVALGSNVCVDLIVPAADVLSIDSTVTPVDVPAINTLNDVNGVFLHHFAAGAAGERSCRDVSVLDGLVTKASSSSSVRKSLGGNAALMAKKLANLGVNVLLSGHVGPVAASLLPYSVGVIANEQQQQQEQSSTASSSSSNTNADTDEVHLILEYGMGTTFVAKGGAGNVPKETTYTASRANRFILTADVSNADIGGSVASLLQEAKNKKAHAVVIAGLHMLEPLEPAVRSQRLESIAEALKLSLESFGSSKGFAIHIELASSADYAWTAAVARALFPYAHSIGFNEVEGAFLYEALGGTYSNITAAAAAAASVLPAIAARTEITSSSPRVVAIASLLRFLFEEFPSSLNRIHFHSLVLHAIAHKYTSSSSSSSSSSSNSASMWREGSGAVAAGAVTATTEACNATVATLIANPDLLYTVSPARINTADPRSSTAGVPVVQSLSASHPIATWTWPLAARGAADGDAIVEFYVSPVPACRKPKSTVGLGDAISASGLGADVAV